MVVKAKRRFDVVGGYEEMVMMWFAEGDGDKVGAMMANVDCIYADVSKRQMPSDERIEFNLCKHEMNTGMRCIKRSSDYCGWRKTNKKHETMTGIPYTSSNSSRFFKAIN